MDDKPRVGDDAKCLHTANGLSDVGVGSGLIVPGEEEAIDRRYATEPVIRIPWDESHGYRQVSRREREGGLVLLVGCDSQSRAPGGVSCAMTSNIWGRE